MKLVSWKTTTIAAVTAVFGFICNSPQYFTKWPILVSISQFWPAGVAAFGAVAKDSHTEAPNGPG